MKCPALSTPRSRALGFSLFEVLIAVGIGGLVTAAAITSFAALQRGFGYCTTTLETRTNQVRLLDAISQDLRDAVDPRPAANAGALAPRGIVLSTENSQKLPPYTILTLTIPQRYLTYETSGPFAGDPLRDDSQTIRLAPSVNTTTGRIEPPQGNYITVRYHYDSNPMLQPITKTRTVRRTVTWLENGEQRSATREVASFSNMANAVAVSFQAPDVIPSPTQTQDEALQLKHPPQGTFFKKDLFLQTTIQARFISSLTNKQPNNTQVTPAKTLSSITYLRARATQ